MRPAPEGQRGQYSGRLVTVRGGANPRRCETIPCRVEDWTEGMRRQLFALALVAVTAAACSRAAASFPSISPIPTLPAPSPTLSPIMQMPNVVGMVFADAKDALKARGLKVSKKEK